MSACIWAELDAVVYGASTLEDANWYWPQSSDMTPRELIDLFRFGCSCQLVPHVERGLCQEPFLHCEQVGAKRGLQLPPNRGEFLTEGSRSANIFSAPSRNSKPMQ